MKILICSKLFYPSNSIGAVRPSNFAKYLAELGHEVVVVTEETFGPQDYKLNVVDIIRVSNSPRVQRFIQINQLRITKREKANEASEFNHVTTKKSALQIKITDPLRKFLSVSKSQLFMLFIESDWAFSSMQIIKKKYKKKYFDIVFSTYGPTGSHFLGYRIFKLGTARHWISDLRDNMVNEDYPFWLNLFYKNAERKILNYAKIVTVVSEGQKTMFINNNKKYCPNTDKIFVVQNGYENQFIPLQSNNKNQLIRIAYTGQLYCGKRDFSMLFHVIDDLIGENKIDTKHIEILYAGPSSEDLKLQISLFSNVKLICNDLGKVEREKALQIQNESDLLVALTWNTRKEQGILTGKFLEYIQAYKPIISLTCGNLANGELSAMVESLNLGIACEYITYETDYIRLKEYIVLQYQHTLNGEVTNFSPDLIGIQKFHFQNITRNLNEIFMQILD